MVMTKLQDGEKLSYAQLHRKLEDQFNIGVTMESLRHRLIKDFGYAWRAIGFATTTKKILYQTRQFLVKYAGPYMCCWCATYSACTFYMTS